MKGVFVAAAVPLNGGAPGENRECPGALAGARFVADTTHGAVDDHPRGGTDHGVDLGAGSRGCEAFFLDQKSHQLLRAVWGREEDSNYGNEMIVSAKELPWLNANFQALEDAINRVRPQDSWVLRHQRLLLHLIALGLGALIQGIFDLLFVWIDKKLPMLWDLFPSPSPNLPWVRLLSSPSAQPFLFVAGWIWRWFLGFFWGAHSIHRWLLEMWPNIEFNFGLPHLQTEKIRRDRLMSVWVLIVVPIITAAIYDLIKAFF